MVDTGRTHGAAALLWLAGAGLLGFAAGRAAVEPGGAAGAVLAGGAALAAAAGFAAVGRGRGSARRGLTGAGWAAFAVGLLAALGPRPAAPDAEPEPAPWTLPDDPDLARELLAAREELEALGASHEERGRILDALLAQALERRERAAAAARAAEEAAERAERERERRLDRLADRLRSDRTLVQAGRIAALDAGPLADRERWQRALAQLEVLDPGLGTPEAIELELDRILRELVASLDARREGAGGPLGTAIAAIESRLRVVGDGR